MQISKACSTEFLSTRTILAVGIYKENFRRARLMRYTCIKTKVRALYVIVPLNPD